MVRYGSKNGHQKDMRLKEIGLCAREKLLIILNFIVNMLGCDLCYNIKKNEDLYFDNE